MLLLWLQPGTGLADSLNLSVVETDDLRLVYVDPLQTYLVPHVIRNFHNSLGFQERTFAWTPNEKPTVVLTDLSDYGNAGAGASPYDGVLVYIAPDSQTFETMPSSERMFMLMNHELVHVANMDVADGADRFWRKFFGGKPRPTSRHPESILYNYLTVPRLSTPRWYLEGAAVFMETWMSGGIGRAQGGYDEMVFRAMVRDDARFYDALGLASEGVNVDFQTGVNAYLYGARFMTWLALEYSPQRLIEWLERGDGSRRYYADNFRAVFGLSVSEAWQDWIAFEHGFQGANLARVREQPLTPLERLTPTALGSISRSYVDADQHALIGAFRYPGVVAHVGVLDLDSGRLRRVVDIKGPMKYRVTSTAWDPASRTLFYAADNIGYRDLMAVNVDTGRHRMLIRDGRIGDLVVNPLDHVLWGLRHLNGYVSLVRMAPPYSAWELVYAWPYGRIPSELDISPDGTRMAMTMGEIDGSQRLQVYRMADLSPRDTAPEPTRQVEFGSAVPEGFVFSPDGRSLYGSSFYTGVSNLFRYDLDRGELAAVSNAETGLFRPMPQSDGTLIAFEYSGQGFRPVRLTPARLEDVGAIHFLGAEVAARYPVVRDWNVVQGLRDIDPESLITRRDAYHPSRELRLDSGYPVVEGYRDGVGLGWNVQFLDPAQLHSLSLSASYSLDHQPSDERPHLDAEYRRLYWRLRYWHNDADFYDLFGPTERSRKGDAFIAGYQRSLIYDDPRMLDLDVEVGYYTGLDTLPSNQNVPVGSLDSVTSADVTLRYTDTRQSLGAVDHEKGWRWMVDLNASDTDLGTVLTPSAGLDFGTALPWKHSSVWLYNAIGAATGDRFNPYANHYFGGFGNNYVDDGEVKRYRDVDSFPGFDIDELSTQTFAKSLAEWNLPPWRFRNVGTPGLFLSDARSALFAGALVTDPGGNRERTLFSAGLQVDWQFTLAHRLPMTLSVGWAQGFEDGHGRGTEWMASLKVL